VSDARSALDRALNSGAPLDPALGSAIVRVAASHGDTKLYDALIAATNRARSPQEHDRYLYAAADFRDPSLIDRALDRTLSSDIRSQDAADYLAAFFENPVARPRAWAFMKQHWAALEPKVTIFGGGTAIVGALANFCDGSTRDDIKAFFAGHPLPSAARHLDQSLERISNCVALQEKQTQLVSDWLASH
jgi:aminopeptidase N